MDEHSPPTIPSAPHRRDSPTSPGATSHWTWPAATVTSVLVLGALVFAGVLILNGVDATTTCQITLVLVLSIVGGPVLGIMGRPLLAGPGRRFLARLRESLYVLTGGGPRQGGDQS